jgi:hypothetical protein
MPSQQLDDNRTLQLINNLKGRLQLATNVSVWKSQCDLAHSRYYLVIPRFIDNTLRRLHSEHGLFGALAVVSGITRGIEAECNISSLK